MEIRSVTLFAEPNFSKQKAADFFTAAKNGFHVPVQTLRLATSPFPTWWRPDHYDAFIVDEVVEPWKRAGVDFLSLGPVALGHDAGWLNHIPQLVGQSENIFLAAEIAAKGGKIDLGRCQAAAEIIRRLSTLRIDGSANMQFAALANVGPGTPFFNAAYHQGGPPHFAIAVESADLAVAAFSQANSLLQAQENLVLAIEKEAAKMSAKASSLALEHGLPFSGLDFTLAPFPSDDRSLAAALEALGLTHLGTPGSLFTAGFAAATVSMANFPRCGFSGLMFPVLEDSVLARRAGAGQLTLDSLISYAAVCGDGLDTIPLPGDIDQNTLTGILLDVAALATRLDKPLVARLMPLPNHAAGDPVNIDFPWFAPARVLSVTGAGVNGHLLEPASIKMPSYHG